MLWKVVFLIDTGYEYRNYNCIIIADNAGDAELKFNNWISNHLKGEEFVRRFEITAIDCNNDIIYHNLYK